MARTFEGVIFACSPTASSPECFLYSQERFPSQGFRVIFLPSWPRVTRSESPGVVVKHVFLGIETRPAELDWGMWLGLGLG